MKPLQLTTTFPTTVTVKDFNPLLGPSPVYTYLRQVMGLSHIEVVTAARNIWLHMYASDELRLTSLHWQVEGKREYMGLTITDMEGRDVPWCVSVKGSDEAQVWADPQVERVA